MSGLSKIRTTQNLEIQANYSRTNVTQKLGFSIGIYNALE